MGKIFGHHGLLSHIDDGFSHVLGYANDFIKDLTGQGPDGPSGVPNDQGAAQIDLFSTDTLTAPEQNAINTTAYMENGGYEMYGSNTAYNEQQNDSTWWDRNKDWLIPTATALLTTGGGMLYNNYQQKKTNDFNAEQNQINRDYQTDMSNTAHQREYADLLATGLNPVNTATGGSGASTPGGGAAAGTAPAYMDHSSMANTALSLAETMKVLNENKYIPAEKKAQIGNIAADTVQKNAATEETQANTEKIKAETENIKEQFNLLSIQEQQMVLDYATAYVNAQNERQKAEIETKFYNTGFGKAMKYTGMTISSILPILGPIGRFASPSKSGGVTVNNVSYTH